MAGSQRFIDIIAEAKLSRAIETYRAEITVRVTTRRKDACLNEALRLRADVVAALIDAGLAANEIEDGSGAFEQSVWSSSKHNSHVIHISHADMQVLMQAMAKVETVFAGHSEHFWSPTKRNFTFGAPKPVYQFDPESADRSLAAAVDEAKAQAEELAEAAGLQINGVESIIQLSRAPKSESSVRNNTWPDDDAIYDLTDDHSGESFVAPVPRQDSGKNTYRIRFIASGMN